MIEIHHDPSELRSNSVLDPSIVDISQALPGLEKLTGADFLISPAISELPHKLRDVRPHHILLRKRTEAGLLIQRKSGSDFLNSIPNLSTLFYRMRDWTPRVWFAYDGSYSVNGDKIILNGRETNWSWNAFMSALLKVQFRGGFVTPHPLIGAQEFATFLQFMAISLQTELDRTEIPKVPGLEIVKMDPKYPIRATLATLPGIGNELSYAFCEYAGSGWETLTAATLKDPPDIKGWGSKKAMNVRAYLGIPADAFALGLYYDKPDGA